MLTMSIETFGGIHSNFTGVSANLLIFMSEKTNNNTKLKHVHIGITTN